MLFTSWYDDVLLDVPGCLPELALKHIRQAAIEFCDQSQLLVKDLEPIVTVPLISTYTTYDVTATDYDIVQLMTVYADGIKIEVKTRDDLIEKYGDITVKYGAAKYFYQESIDEVILCPIPDVAVTLTFKAAVKPSRTSTLLDDWVSTKYFDAIAHGAKGHLFEIPKKPWSDPALAGYHLGKFEGLISEARSNKSLGMARAPNRTKLW